MPWSGSFCCLTPWSGPYCRRTTYRTGSTSTRAPSRPECIRRREMTRSISGSRWSYVFSFLWTVRRFMIFVPLPPLYLMIYDFHIFSMIMLNYCNLLVIYSMCIYNLYCWCSYVTSCFDPLFLLIFQLVKLPRSLCTVFRHYIYIFVCKACSLKRAAL